MKASLIQRHTQSGGLFARDNLIGDGPKQNVKPNFNFRKIQSRQSSLKQTKARSLSFGSSRTTVEHPLPSEAAKS